MLGLITDSMPGKAGIEGYSPDTNDRISEINDEANVRSLDSQV
jgi:hypothetical protein